MEKENNKSIVILIAVVSTIILLVILLATEAISFKKNTSSGIQNVGNPTGNQVQSEPSSSSIDNDEVDQDDTVEEDTYVFIVNEEATKIVKDIMEKFYGEVFYGHRETYCGDADYDDIIENKDEVSKAACNYYRSKTYNSLSSLKAHLGTYISSDFIDYMLKDYYMFEGHAGVPKYQEANNKLYCLKCARGALMFNKNDTTYGILSYTDSEIKAIVNVAAFSEGNNSNKFKAIISLNKINDKWLLSSYEEKY